MPAEMKEGYGMTNTENELIMTDGTDYLFFVRPSPGDFKINRKVKVTNPKANIKNYNRLNELEYVYGYVFANIWLTDLIVVINPDNGEIVK